MNDIKIFGHIKSVRAAITVYFVTAVVHSKSDEGIVMFPMTVNEGGDHSEIYRVCAKLTECFCAFGVENSLLSMKRMGTFRTNASALPIRKGESILRRKENA